MDQLWKQCYGFICQQALKWAGAFKDCPSFDEEDFTQSGYIALCGAVRGYQSDRGNFLGYLLFFLKTEFSKVAGCRTVTQRKEPINNAISLDAPAYNDQDNDTTICENIPVEEPGFEAVEDDVFNSELAVLLGQALQKLPEKQRRTIELRYLHGLTVTQVAEALKCSASYSGQLTKQGLKAIRTGEFALVLSEALYGDRNYYRRTSLSFWKYSGLSSPEFELLRKDDKAQSYARRYCIEKLGMTRAQARRLFPV